MKWGCSPFSSQRWKSGPPLTRQMIFTGLAFVSSGRGGTIGITGAGLVSSGRACGGIGISVASSSLASPSVASPIERRGRRISRTSILCGSVLVSFLRESFKACWRWLCSMKNWVASAQVLVSLSDESQVPVK